MTLRPAGAGGGGMSVHCQWANESVPELRPISICKEQLFDQHMMCGVFEMNRLTYTGEAHHLIGQGSISLCESQDDDEFVSFECALTKRGMKRGTLYGKFRVER